MTSPSPTLAHVRAASRSLVHLSAEQIDTILTDLADAILERGDEILVENERDLKRMDESNPKYDRLMLTEERLEGIAADMKNVASLPSPLGEILEERDLPNGIHLQKVRVPMGVIGVIYESRPNVTFDVFALCFKSGNACVLKGSDEAEFSNIIGVEIIHDVLKKHSIDTNVVTLLPPEREAIKILFEATEEVDVIIPRGSQGLIDLVRENAKVPVIETGAGICHTYVDSSADISKAATIVCNAKTRRPSVCNSLDCLVVHEDQLENLPAITTPLKEHNVEIFADQKAFEALQGNYPNDLLRQASDEHFGMEFLSMKMSIKTVSTLDEAIEHITQYSSKHSEAVVAEDEAVVDRFLKEIDAAAVYANTSTAFSDGAQFGLGAEIGISTQKLHARGPMGLKELTSYKWVLQGSGQTRS